MAPDKIYLAWDYSKIDTLPPGVTAKQVFGKDVCYIRKDALLEWAKNLKERWEEPPMSKHSPGCVFMLEQVIDKLNSM